MKPRPAGQALPDHPVKSRHALAVTLGCSVGVLLVGVVDYATGVEARVFPLYYVPIAIGARGVSRAVGVSLALLSTALWALAMWLAGPPWGTQIFLLNTLTQWASFMLVALLIADIARRFEAERDVSRTDNLTSLPNGRAFYELAEVLVAGARRFNRPFTLAYIDLDNFKVVNDEQGHLEGDSALRQAAEVLRRETRAGDIAARVGGDEFVVFLPDTGPEAARTVLERLGKLLADKMNQSQWPITASIGAMSFLQAPATLEAAVQGADSLMYRAKRAGKNRLLLETVGSQDRASVGDATGGGGEVRR